MGDTGYIIDDLSEDNLRMELRHSNKRIAELETHKNIMAYAAMVVERDALKARVEELEAGLRWIQDDAQYKAPEQIGVVPERWIERIDTMLLKEAGKER